jgi:hypothetical protein
LFFFFSSFGREKEVQEEFQCKLDSSIVLLEHLSVCTTPLEKLQCIQEVVNSISKAVELASKARSSAEPPTITTDDLLPLIVEVIIRARPQFIHSDLYYMENFTFCNIANTSFG